jgi:hypothetical protein
MMTPQERYERDPLFHRLVDTIHEAIRRCQYTATEVREAAMLAAIHHDSITVRHVLFNQDMYR